MADYRNRLNDEVDPFEDLPARTMADVARQTYAPRTALTEMPPARPKHPGALAPAGDDAVQVGRLTLTPIGIRAAEGVTEGEWLRFYTSIRRVKESLQWAIADWLLIGERQWGKTYAQMAGTTGLKEKTLREYAYVARNIDLSIRMDKLSFAHHQLVAALPAVEQVEKLQHALDNRLSVGRFRMYLEGRTPDPAVVKFEKSLIGLWGRYRKRTRDERRMMAGLLRQMADAMEAEESGDE